MEDRIVKIQNVGPTDLPVHEPGAKGCAGRGCEGCVVPQWNRIKFPIKKGAIKVVKENVGSHLQRRFPRAIKVVGGPYNTTQLLQSPEGFFEHDAATGTFKPLDIKVDTTHLGSSQDPDADGETPSDVKANPGRLTTEGGDVSARHRERR